MTTVNNVKINPEQRLFVISSSDGYSCFGFDNCFAHAQQLSQLLKRPDLAPNECEIGELKQYALYRQLTDLARGHDLGTYFDPGTLPEVKRILEDFRQSQKRLRLFMGDDVTGRDWLEENDVVGRIGRSRGPLKVPLLIGTGECSGPAILTKFIVRILCCKTGRELYRHPSYNLAELTIHSCTKGKYKAEVRANGELHARFTTTRKAENWIAFMKGERMTA